MILIDDDLLAIWYIHLPRKDQDGDMLASLRRRSPTELEIIWRFRYYETPGPWDGLDRKNWYGGTTTSALDEAVAKMRVLLDLLSSMAPGSKVYECLRGSRGTDEFMAAFSRMPFVHMKEGKDAEEWARTHKPEPYRAPLPVHYMPSGTHRTACPIEIIGTNVTADAGQVTCRRCAKHVDVIAHRNNSSRAK
jgi:hypothetical protein